MVSARRTAGERSAGNPLAALFQIAQSALTVDHLATRLDWRPSIDDPPDQVLAIMEREDFDYALLRGGPPHSFVLRRDLSGVSERLAEVACAVSTADLVTASLGLADAVERLAERDALFVLDGREITGIATRADIQKQAVSMVAFSLALAAEAGLDRLISWRYPDEQWLAELGEEARRNLEGRYDERVRSNAEISHQECMALTDRLNLIGKDPELRSKLGFQSRRQFETDTKTLRKVRNTLAHGNDLLAVTPDPCDAIGTFLDVRRLAEQVWDVCAQLERPTEEA